MTFSVWLLVNQFGYFTIGLGGIVPIGIFLYVFVSSLWLFETKKFSAID